jgi:hypothetical membrane protein
MSVTTEGTLEPLPSKQPEGETYIPRRLLWAGIAAVAVYFIGDLVAGLLYSGYSFRDQAISELSAYGSPVRPLMVTVILLHDVLLIAFGVAVWRRVAARKSLRWAGLSLAAIGVSGLPTHTVFAMSSRWMDAGFNDTMHQAFTGIFTLLVVVAIVLSAIAYPGGFRRFSIGVLVVLAGFGAAAAIAIQGIEENATAWAGGFERINAYAYFAWLIALAAILLRSEATQAQRDQAATFCVQHFEPYKGDGHGTRQPVRSR